MRACQYDCIQAMCISSKRSDRISLNKKDWGDYLVFQQILRNFAIVMTNPLRPP